MGRICRKNLSNWSEAVLTAHFHNTRGMGLANALAAMNAGIDHLNASLGGLGGCAYAPGASGKYQHRGSGAHVPAHGHGYRRHLDNCCVRRRPAGTGRP